MALAASGVISAQRRVITTHASRPTLPATVAAMPPTRNRDRAGVEIRRSRQTGYIQHAQMLMLTFYHAIVIEQRHLTSRYMIAAAVLMVLLPRVLRVCAEPRSPRRYAPSLTINATRHEYGAVFIETDDSARAVPTGHSCRDFPVPRPRRHFCANICSWQSERGRTGQCGVKMRASRLPDIAAHADVSPVSPIALCRQTCAAAI